MCKIEEGNNKLVVINGTKTDDKKTWKTEPSCHTGFTEVYPGLFVGKKYAVDKELLSKVNVLVPLDSVDSDIWKDGYRGMIMYVPTKDYGTLPKDVEEHFVNQTVKLLAKGKKVAVFCIGGHGRTGYFSSLVLGKLGIEDPIKHLRENYCKKAVEDQSQVDAISEFFNHPEWKTEYKAQPKVYGYSYGGYASWYDDEINTKIPSTEKVNNKHCGECAWFEPFKTVTEYGNCCVFNKTERVLAHPCKWFDDISNYTEGAGTDGTVK